MKEAIVLMAKAPLSGTVKTRLIPSLDEEKATALYVAFLNDTFALLEEIRAECEAQAEEAELDDYLFSVVLNFTPADAEDAFAEVERESCLMLPQRGMDLGERISNCFSDLFTAGYESIVIIGADSPTLPGEYLLDAFDALDNDNKVVIGPTADGGYYLIGARFVPKQLCEFIPWSSGQVLSETLKRANEANIEIVLLPEWYDVDTPADLLRLREELAQNNETAPYTRRCLRSLE